MSEKQTSPAPKPASASTDAAKASDHGKAAIQAVWDKANDQGYFGTVPDETPNEDYTVAGVTRKAKGGK
jgi:hypothetical protein